MHVSALSFVCVCVCVCVHNVGFGKARKLVYMACRFRVQALARILSVLV